MRPLNPEAVSHRTFLNIRDAESQNLAYGGHDQARIGKNEKTKKGNTMR